MKSFQNLSVLLFWVFVIVPLYVTAQQDQGHDHSRQDPDKWQPVLFAEDEMHAPAPLPDRIVLTWMGDPSVSQAVTWRTDTTIVRAVAQIDFAKINGRELKGETVNAQTIYFSSDLGKAHYHNVNFTNLQPDMLYAYRVGDGVNWSEWFQFRTASREAKPFSFIYFGDAQADVRSLWSRVFREAFRNAPRAAFTLHAGDLINRANRDAEWGEWFGAPAWVNATIPVIATPGNHEYYSENAGSRDDRKWDAKKGEVLEVTIRKEDLPEMNGKDVGSKVTVSFPDGTTGNVLLDANGYITNADKNTLKITGYKSSELVGVKPGNPPLNDRQSQPGDKPQVSRHWRPQFAFPENGLKGLEETNYYVDYQGVRIVSLNSNERQDEQARWLREILKNNPCRWIIITFHHPMYSPARGRDNSELREIWKPIFDEFGVDMVLTGHDHTYARSNDPVPVGTVNIPTGANRLRVGNTGTVYVVSVSGPKLYNIVRAPWMTRAADYTQLYQIITVDPWQICYEARTATGQLYDSFVLKKHDGQPNELIEALPPERISTQ